MIIFGDLTIASTPFAELNYTAPEGSVALVTPPDSVLTLQSFPEGLLAPLPIYQSVLSYSSYSSSLQVLPTPLAQVLEVLLIPVLSIDDDTGFILLDDGGRLQIN